MAMHGNCLQARIDPEAPAGGEWARARVAPAAFKYRGRGDAHWREQVCFVEDSETEPPFDALVIFACGCRAIVNPHALKPLR